MSGVIESRLRRWSHCDAKFVTRLLDRGSASMRVTWRSSTAGLSRSPRAARSISSSSGMLLQRKNDSRDASSRSLIGYTPPADTRAGSRSMRKRNSGLDSTADSPISMPASNPSAAFVVAYSSNGFFRSASVTGRRYARRIKLDRIFLAQPSSF